VAPTSEGLPFKVGELRQLAFGGRSTGRQAPVELLHPLGQGGLLWTLHCSAARVKLRSGRDGEEVANCMKLRWVVLFSVKGRLSIPTRRRDGARPANHGPRCNLHAHVLKVQAIDLDGTDTLSESLRAGLGRIHIHRSQVQPHTDCGEWTRREVVCPPCISSGEPAKCLSLVEVSARCGCAAC